MSLEKFTHIAQNHESIALVGPFFKKKHLVSLPLYLFVDGGTRFKNEVKASFSFSIGDGDSYKGPLDIALSQKKDYSDLKEALHILPSSIKTVHLLGFLGGRLDHQLFVFGDVHDFMKKRETRFYFERSVLGFPPGREEPDIHGFFSLTVMETGKITLKGRCDYHLNSSQFLPPLSSRGLDNRARGRIFIESEKPFFIFLHDTPPS